MTSSAPNIFESFNARSLKPSQVAKTFVPSDAFEQLCARRHSLVLGPRGSGKTTLLKMLQPAALEVWNHQSAERLIARLDFVGVFVPFDRSWQAQVAALGGNAVPSMTKQILGHAAFTTHLYRNIIACLLHRVDGASADRQLHRVSLSPAGQAQLATLLAEVWETKLPARSLRGLRLGLANRLREIGSLSRRLVVLDIDRQAALLEGQVWLHHPFVEGLTAALDAWEHCTQQEPECWGLAFDELELAPSSIKRVLFDAIRSIDQRVLLKLALSPYDDTLSSQGDANSPQPGQDYDEILLWFTEKKRTEPFCSALWTAMLRDRGLPFQDPRAAFGRSHFETPAAEWSRADEKTAYGRGSRQSMRFEQLARIDPTFRRFLRDKGLDPLELDLIPAASRAAEIRKIAPLVEARLFFLRLPKAERTKSVDKETARRSRKRLTLYTGWDTYCAVSEGNPRWFIGMTSALLSQAQLRAIRFQQGRQAEVIADAARKYRAALRTIPVTGAALSRRRGLLTIIDVIAKYFRERQIEDPFTGEPPGSFLVDSQVPADVALTMRQALNAGAMVYVQDDDTATATMDVFGKRFRLCYLIAASAGLMPRLARAIRLSSIVATRPFKQQEVIQFEPPRGSR